MLQNKLNKNYTVGTVVIHIIRRLMCYKLIKFKGPRKKLHFRKIQLIKMISYTIERMRAKNLQWTYLEFRPRQNVVERS